MKVLVNIKLSPHKFKTPEGYLLCQDAIIARTGKQSYMKSELYPDDPSNEIVEVDRPEEEVFNEATMASFEDKPITDEHPDENVGPENYSRLAIGHTKNIRKGSEKIEGEYVMLADLLITDPSAIEQIETGRKTELSCGYDCDITDGPNPKQINIRGNHVALCAQGRAGIARIVDSKPVEDDMKQVDYKGYTITLGQLLKDDDVVYVIHKDTQKVAGGRLDMSNEKAIEACKEIIDKLESQVVVEDTESDTERLIREEAKAIHSYESAENKSRSKVEKELYNHIKNEEREHQEELEQLLEEGDDFEIEVDDSVSLNDYKDFFVQVPKQIFYNKFEVWPSKGEDWGRCLDENDSFYIVELIHKDIDKDIKKYVAIRKTPDVNVKSMKEMLAADIANDKEAMENKVNIKFADSVTKGGLIQEFGKQGDQYKITKIEGNVIYANEIVSGKIVLFHKDKEGIEWASITKSEIRDSIPNELVELIGDIFCTNDLDIKSTNSNLEINYSNSIIRNNIDSDFILNAYKKQIILALEKAGYNVTAAVYNLEECYIKIEYSKNKEGEVISPVSTDDSLDTNADLTAIKDLLANINVKEYKVVTESILIYFNKKVDRTKAVNILKDKYDIESFTKEDEIYIAVYDKLKIKIEDSNDLDKHSRKFYIKLIDELKMKLEELEKVKDSQIKENYDDYNLYKANIIEELNKQIDYCKGKIEELDREGENE